MARFIAILSLAALVLIPLSFAAADSPAAGPVRTLPHTVHRGETFNVTVTFTSPVDTFSFPVIKEIVPPGWTVVMEGEWCTPPPDKLKVTNNLLEILWEKDNLSQGTPFTVVYEVTVSDTAPRGNNLFSGTLYYHCDPAHPLENITEITGGDSYVYVPLPEISFTPELISFTASQGGASPRDRKLEIWNSGEETLEWTLSCSDSWLGVDSTEGSSSGEHSVIVVSADITGMAAGDYSATITITSPVANNSPQVVPVSLNISPRGGGGGGGGGRTAVAGDANGDGVVTPEDITAVMKIILGTAELTPGADCNGDGEVNALDITAIKRILFV